MFSPSSPNQSLLSSTEGFQLAALGPPGWKSPLLHLPSQQSSWRAGPSRSSCQVQEPLPGWEPRAEAPPGLPKHRKAACLHPFLTSG